MKKHLTYSANGLLIKWGIEDLFKQKGVVEGAELIAGYPLWRLNFNLACDIRVFVGLEGTKIQVVRHGWGLQKERWILASESRLQALRNMYRKKPSGWTIETMYGGVRFRHPESVTVAVL
jgi:hypothetical protein